MTPAETETVRQEIAAILARAEAAEQRVVQITAERDHLRALLTRFRTSLAEVNNDPGLGS